MKFALSEARNGERAAVILARQPLARQRQGQHRGSQGSAQVRTALAPVKTGISEAATQRVGAIEIETERSKGARSIGRELVSIPAAKRLDPARADEVVVKRDGDSSGHVVVAGTCGAERFRRVGNKLTARSAGKDAETFEGARDAGAGERIVAMASLHEDRHEVLGFESRQVNAGRRRGNLSNQAQFGPRARVPIHKRVEHPGASGLSDGCGDRGHSGVDVRGAAG